MIVVDASAILAAQVTLDQVGEKAGRRLNSDLSHQAPQLVKAEALSGLRKLVASGDVTPQRAATVVGRIERVRIETYPIDGFISRIWGLRDNLSVYDAWYVALAEALQVPLITTDRRLQRAPGIECEVELIA